MTKFCIDCGSVLTEYVGLNTQEGEGDFFCKRCEQDGPPPNKEDSDDTDPYGIVIPDWDMSFLSTICLNWKITTFPVTRIIDTLVIDLPLPLPGHNAIECGHIIAHGHRYFRVSMTTSNSTAFIVYADEIIIK